MLREAVPLGFSVWGEEGGGGVQKKKIRMERTVEYFLLNMISMNQTALRQQMWIQAI